MSATSVTDVAEELVRRYDVPGPRYTSYPTADRWGPLSSAEHAFALAQAGQRGHEVPLSVYVHLPFCRSLCLYCGCNVVVASRPEAADRYLAALEREMDLVCDELGGRRQVAQLHWGGGTPTFLDEPRLERLFRALTQRFTLVPQAEVAIEIDPRVTTASQLRVLRDLGFDRLSLGVQDFDPGVQDAIGRHQDLGVTRTVFTEARRLGFDRINFDLVYGLPRQSRESWRATLAAVCALGPDRVAAYSFAYVPTVRRQQKRLPVAGMLTGAAKLRLLLDAHAILGAAGYQPIGMDHFARGSDELAIAQARGRLQRNFQGYTVGRASDVVALGATGISDLDGATYAQNVRDLGRYCATVESGQLATARGMRLDADDRRRRQIISALMCNFRVELDDAELASFGAELAALAPLARDGLVEVNAGRIEVTPTGRLFVRNVATVFDTHRDQASVAASRTV